MYSRSILFILILLSLLLKIWMADSLELGNSEAYYWVLSKHLQPGYFDHPPVLPWLIRLFTWMCISPPEWLVRAPALAAGLISTYLLYATAKRHHSRMAGVVTALLFTATGYGCFAAGTFILPDSPLMVFWFLALQQGLGLVTEVPGKKINLKSWILFGLWAGLALISKYQGIFLWIGMITYTFRYQRRWLRQRAIYFSLLTTTLIAAPLFLFQITQRMDGFRFHAARIIPSFHDWTPVLFLQQLAAVVLIMNPLVLGMFLREFLRKKNNGLHKGPAERWSLLATLPLLAAFGLLSLFRESLPHWPGPGVATLCLLTALRLGPINTGKKAKLPLLLVPAVLFTFLIGVSQVWLTNHFPGILGTDTSELRRGENDPTLDMYGWRTAAKAVDSVFRNDRITGIEPNQLPLLAPDWETAAHLEYYFSAAEGQRVLAFGNPDSLHEYKWLNRERLPLRPGSSAYFLVSSERFDYHQLTNLSQAFDRYILEKSIPVSREGMICRQLYVFRCEGYRAK